MSETLRRHAELLKALHRASPAKRRKWMRQHCSLDFVKCMCECARNVIKGNVPLTPAQLKALRRKRQALRQLTLKKTSLTKKKKLLQSGGFLGAILPPIISVLGGLLGSAFGSK